MTTENSPLPIAQTGRCCGSNAADPTLTATSEDLATCPVMAGATVVKSVAEAQGLFRDHNGNRYWFCCASCGPAFDADPDKYATTA